MANTSESHTISNFWNTSSTFINHRWNNYMELWLSSPASRVGPVVQLPPVSVEQPHCAAAPGLVLLQIVNLLQVESSMATLNITKHLQKLESHSIEALCKAFFAIGMPNCLNQMIGLFALRMNLLESAKMTDPCSCLLRLVVGNAKQTRIKLMLSHTFPCFPTDRTRLRLQGGLCLASQRIGWGIWMILNDQKWCQSSKPTTLALACSSRGIRVASSIFAAHKPAGNVAHTKICHMQLCSICLERLQSELYPPICLSINPTIHLIVLASNWQQRIVVDFASRVNDTHLDTLCKSHFAAYSNTVALDGIGTQQVSAPVLGLGIALAPRAHYAFHAFWNDCVVGWCCRTGGSWTALDRQKMNSP